MDYLWLFILNGSFIFGYVDKVEDHLALVEIKSNDSIEHKFVFINKKICIPKEGQAVFMNHYEIIKCL